MSEAKKTFARKAEFALRTIDDQAVLMPLGDGGAGHDFIYTLNEVGAAIWQLIEPGRDAAAIGRLIAQEFDVSVERASEDVRNFLELLVSKGLIDEA
jgi:hypothetical protein